MIEEHKIGQADTLILPLFNNRAGFGCNSWVDGQEYSGEWKDNSRNGKIPNRL